MTDTTVAGSCKDYDLPEAIIVWEILVRLPPDDLARCRAVRRSWRHATSTGDFLLANHRRQPALPIMHLFNDTGPGAAAAGTVVEDPRLVVFRGAEEPRPVVRYAVAGKDCLALHGARDGLLLLSSTGICAPWRRFYLCNPATRRWSPVHHLLEPRLGRPCFSVHVVGFYQHQPSGEYRVLTCCTGSGLRPKTTAHPSTTFSRSDPASPAAVTPLVFAIGLPCSSDYPPVLYLHWELQGPLYESFTFARDSIVAFDAAAETFRLMRRPAHLFRRTSLLEMKDGDDGTIGLCGGSGDGRVMEFWVLMDYDAEVWTLKHRINLEALAPSPPVDPVTLFFSPARVVVLDNDEREVLLVPRGRWKCAATSTATSWGCWSSVAGAAPSLAIRFVRACFEFLSSRCKRLL
ncbi:hypothetical protein QOZ80_4AG0316850 [Eleusine coracana subsp. coracana]|nr:hypothetical protein QOZ80_4AG0316850 [Eleusine coracana subsp. coracana]